LAAKRYIRVMGGADAVLANAKADYENGDYRWVAEILNHLVFAEPDNRQARELLASARENCSRMMWNSRAANWICCGFSRSWIWPVKRSISLPHE